MLGNKNMPEFGPLQGVKVIHASASLAGPFSAQLMADYGADVVWIENPDIPDISRYGTNVIIPQERRNQRNLAINLATPEGKEIFLKMLKDVDVFLETSKAGQYTKWGLTDEVMWEANPKLVILHISGFGQTGLAEYIKRPSFDPLAQAVSGLMNQNGFEDREGIPVVPFMADYITGLYGAFSIMSAVYKAKMTGQGESIDLAQYEVLLRSQIYFADYRTKGLTYKREGSRSAVYAGWGAFECKDGKGLYIIFIGGGVMKRGLPFIGLEYGTDLFPKGCSIMTLDSPAGEALEKHLKAYLETKDSAEEAEKELVENGIPASRIMTYADIVKDPHVIKRDIFADWVDFKGKTIKGIGAIPKLKNNPGRVWRAAPELGMDNEEILEEVGYTSDQVENLYSKGIIGKTKSEAK